MSADKPTVFISYSHKDVKWKDRLVRHLRVLGGERDFDVWDDQRIRPGDDWRDAIERALISAHVAVLLVSVDFLDSAFIRGVEIPKLLQRRQSEGLSVMPVIVWPCGWQHIPWLAAMQVRPRGGRALSGGSKHEIEAALARIAGEVNEALEQQKARRAAAQGAEPAATEPTAGVGAPSEPARPGPPLSADVAASSEVAPGTPAPDARVAEAAAAPPRDVARVSEPLGTGSAAPPPARATSSEAAEQTPPAALLPRMEDAAPARRPLTPHAEYPDGRPTRGSDPADAAPRAGGAARLPTVEDGVLPAPTVTPLPATPRPVAPVTEGRSGAREPAPTALDPRAPEAVARAGVPVTFRKVPRVVVPPRATAASPATGLSDGGDTVARPRLPTARWRRVGMLVLVAGAVTGGAFGVYLWLRPRPVVLPTPASEAPSVWSTPTPQAAALPPAPSGVTLHPFQFDTVKLGPQGQELERRKLSARMFTEDLGGGVQLDMVAVPGGTFTMGAPKEETDSADHERPQRKVTLEPFFIGKFEVTQAQWRAVAAWPRVARDLPPNPARFKGGERPVEMVPWPDAVEFCARLRSKTGRSYRLPSEAEWEYAARAGTTTAFAFGSTITPAIVNYDGDFPYGGAAKGRDRKTTVDVGSLRVANQFGLFDMHGNVWEWTQDVWHNSYDGAPSDGRAWESRGKPGGRALRGGAWSSYARNCRSAVRRYWPELRDDDVGVRVVCAVSRTQS